ncbi:MAG: ferritin-like domain-containing protein [Acidimicrobiales bacterium]
MDRDKLIELLNEDLQTEYQSIVQYIQHTATIKGPEYISTVEELRAHLSQELEHALMLAEQVDFLGGTPTVEVPSIRSAADSRGALELDLELETSQLERYRERVEQTTEMGLPDVAEVLRPLLQQTQDHVRDLQSALGL